MNLVGAGQQNALSRFERQYVPLVLEQHHGFRGAPCRKGFVALETGEQRRVVEIPVVNSRFEERVQRGVDHPLQQRLHFGPALRGTGGFAQDVFPERGVFGHEQRFARREHQMLQLRIVARILPVGHGHPLEAVLPAEYVGDERLVHRAGQAVGQVVARHDAETAGFGDHPLPREQIDLAQGPFVDDAVGDVAAEVLIVAQKMFGRGDDAVPLQPLDIGRGHDGGEQGVFAHILEIPSADR